MMSGRMIVRTSGGMVRGKILDRDSYRYEAYLGIPYGRAERFCAPVPARWEGVLDCREYRSCAMQPNRLGEIPPGEEFSVVGSEDCLNLNLWKNCGESDSQGEQEEDEKLPVVVYIHGGAFQVGSNQSPTRSGDNFLEGDRMIYVSVNYRLGVLGFLQLGEAMPRQYRSSGNCGTMDVLMALHWVHENVEAFGGDPTRVTVMGISAGAKMLGSLLTLPEVQDLASQVVLESGAMQSFRSVHTARCVARDYEKHLGIDSENELLTMPAEQLVLAQAHFCAEPGTTCYFGPVMDGILFGQGEVHSWKGAALLGSGRNELVHSARRKDFAGVCDRMIKNLFGNNAVYAREALTREELLLRESSMEERWTRVLSDFMYRFYTDQLAKRLVKEGNPVWVYSFEFGPACHGMGFSFLQHEENKPIFGVAEEDLSLARAVSDQMRRYVRRFVMQGDPNGGEDLEWPCYEGRRKMIFDRETHVEDRPEDALMGFPESVYER